MIRQLNVLSIVSLTVALAAVPACTPDQGDAGANDTGTPGAEDVVPDDVTDGADDTASPDTTVADTRDSGEPDTLRDIGDGVDDGESDAADTGEVDADSGPDCDADSDADGLDNCEEAEMCTDPNEGDTDDDGLGDFEELQYQTDPCDSDTDNDGASDKDEIDNGLNPTRPNEDLWAVQACDNPNAESVTFHENGTGDWTLALPTAFDNYTELSLSNVQDPVASAVYGDPATEVAGALLSKDVETNHSSPTEPLRTDVLSAIQNSGSIVQDRTGGEFDTHDEKVAASGRYLIETDDTMSVRRLRQDLLLKLAPFPKADAGGLPNTSGAQYKSFRVFVSIIFREEPNGDDQSLISISVSPDQKFQNLDKVRFRMDDLTNTTNIAEQVDSHLTKCSTVQAAEETPKAEFYWVLDQSGSMRAENTTVANFAEQFQQEVQNTSLDYQMGVTNMVQGNEGHLRVPPAWHTAPSTFKTEVDEAVIDCTDTGSWTCDGVYEYGLEVAQKGIEYMTGNASQTPTAAERVRSNAKIITIFISDEEANSIKRDNEDLQQYKDFFRDRTTAFAIVGDGEGCGSDDGAAYKDVALETGGKIASLCAKDLTQTIRDIIIATTGETSQYELPETPISSSLRVVKNGQWVPRSTEDGFEYFEENNAVAFFGSHRPTPGSEDDDGDGDFIAIHYETFKDRCKPSADNDCSP